MKQPWLKFFPADWRADMDLRMCSLEARGLWIEMLCIMSEAEPRGFLARKGEPVTNKQLAILVGVREADLRAPMAELEAAGVFSRNGQGVILSRRMVRDEQKSDAAKANGSLGGNPHLLNRDKQKQEVTTPPLNLLDNRGDKTQKLEARNQKEGNLSVSCPKRVRARNEYPQDFETFWGEYPTDSNMSKSQAGKAWNRLSDADKKDATASLPAFKRFCKSRPDYRPLYAERYLTQRRWEGHLKTAAAVEKRVFVHQESPQWLAWAEYYRRRDGRSPPIDQNGGWNFPTEWPPKMSEELFH